MNYEFNHEVRSTAQPMTQYNPVTGKSEMVSWDKLKTIIDQDEKVRNVKKTIPKPGGNPGETIEADFVEVNTLLRVDMPEGPLGEKEWFMNGKTQYFPLAIAQQALKINAQLKLYIDPVILAGLCAERHIEVVQELASIAPAATPV